MNIKYKKFRNIKRTVKPSDGLKQFFKIVERMKLKPVNKIVKKNTVIKEIL